MSELTKGNEWWRLITKHGRDKLFSDGSVLREECFKYFEKTDERKWLKRGEHKDIKLDTPYTLSGLCVFLDIDMQTWRNYRKDESNKDIFGVVKTIDKIIYTQKFEGAVVAGLLVE